MFSLSDALIEAAARYPTKTFLIEPACERTVSFQEVLQSVRELADVLQEAGVQPHDRVLVHGEKTLEVVLLALAIQEIRAVAVLLNAAVKSSQIAHVVSDCHPRLIITSPRCREVADAAATEASFLTKVNDVSELMARCSGQRFNRPRQRVSSNEHAPAMIFYTSGSTGKPKGVVLSHRNLIAGAQSVNQYLENTSKDVILSILPLGFDAGFSQITTALLAGATVVLHDYLLPSGIGSLCERYGVSQITAIPMLWRALVSVSWPPPARAGLRLFANTGGSMTRELFVRLCNHFPHARPYLMYGFTEAFRSTYLDPADAHSRPTSIGKAVPNAEILVLDKYGNECSAGEQGQLVHRGATVALGYWNNEDASLLKFGSCSVGIEPGVTRAVTATAFSGDIVVRDEDGFLFFVGRVDEQIKSRGVRISPTEVEDVIYQSGLIDEVVVIGRPSLEHGEDVVAIVVPRDALLSVEGLLAYCTREMPSYMVPRNIVVQKELPKLTNGKLDRSAIRSLFSGRSDISIASVA